MSASLLQEMLLSARAQAGSTSMRAMTGIFHGALAALRQVGLLAEVGHGHAGADSAQPTASWVSATIIVCLPGLPTP
jgi:hypothetical protein